MKKRSVGATLRIPSAGGGVDSSSVRVSSVSSTFQLPCLAFCCPTVCIKPRICRTSTTGYGPRRNKPIKYRVDLGVVQLGKIVDVENRPRIRTTKRRRLKLGAKFADIELTPRATNGSRVHGTQFDWIYEVLFYA